MSIRRHHALREYDVKETPAGKPVVHSLKFVKKNGELVFLPRAIACGLPFDVKSNRMRGFQPVDIYGNNAGHINPVHIDGLIEWNGLTVTL
jgi:hypothetical protein